MKCIGSNIQINCKDETKIFDFPAPDGMRCEDNYQVCFEEEEKQGCRVGRINLSISRKDTWDMTGLAVDAPIKMVLEMDEIPENMTCMYMFNPWWTRPAFVTEMNNIPDKTQILFGKYKDHYSCFLPMVGKIFKTTVCCGENKNRMHLKMEAGIGGLRKADEVVYLLADADTVEEAVEKVFHYLNHVLGIRLREERSFPKMLQYLGWCSWDAFYKEINEEKIRAKAEELIEKKIPVRWMLFDDGWMEDKDDMLCRLEPDGEKFPTGFDTLITDIKKRSSVSWFGVWHAFGGYWAGVDPESELAEAEKEHLYATANGRLVPSPTKGAGFYRDWYEVLKKQQIDFVKVDGQSAVPIYFQQDQPTASAARGMNRELEKGAELLDKNIVNCMGMAMENILARPETGVSRNSDDFFPNREGGFAEHLLQNAYNSLYHNEMYYCDWDMFWTMHPDAEKHSLLRAISGGPVYFSDRIGETSLEVVEKLCLQDGKLLMMKRSAKPAEDSIFVDPLYEGILKLQNVGVWSGDKTGGVIAAFNLTPEKQETVISVKDIPELEKGKKYWLYDYYANSAEVIGEGDEKRIILNSEEYAYYILLPKDDSLTCLGLIDKYAGFLAIRGHKRIGERTMSVQIAETGSFAWLSDTAISRVIVNGKDETDKVQKKGFAYQVELEDAPEKMEIEFISPIL
ncbi:MAG: hypothetical protein EOM18_03015 [Clostridia bacterium]|nr:hypothetical protein [Clostridia bacterium]